MYPGGGAGQYFSAGLTYGLQLLSLDSTKAILIGSGAEISADRPIEFVTGWRITLTGTGDAPPANTVIKAYWAVVRGAVGPVGPQGPGSFDLHDDLGTEMTSPDGADRLVASDESLTGDPNRWLSLTNLRTWLNIPSAASGFDVHDDLGTELTSPDGADRIPASDESVTGDPNRYLTLSNLVTWLNTQITSGGSFDLHDDVGTELTSLSLLDRLIVSDESVTGEPNRYATLSTLRSYLEGSLSLNTDRISGGTLGLARGGTGGTTAVTAREGLKIFALTQAEYDALATPDSEAVYIITG